VYSPKIYLLAEDLIDFGPYHDMLGVHSRASIFLFVSFITTSPSPGHTSKCLNICVPVICPLITKLLSSVSTVLHR